MQHQQSSSACATNVARALAIHQHVVGIGPALLLPRPRGTVDIVVKTRGGGGGGGGGSGGGSRSGRGRVASVAGSFTVDAHVSRVGRALAHVGPRLAQPGPPVHVLTAGRAGAAACTHINYSMQQLVHSQSRNNSISHTAATRSLTKPQ